MAQLRSVHTNRFRELFLTIANTKSRTLDGGHVPRHVRQYMVELLFGAAHADVNEHARSHSPHVVPALQFYGTEFRRALDENYWVNKTQARLQSLEMAGKIPVVTDGRFPNEILSILDLGGEVVRIEVDPQVRAQRLQARHLAWFEVERQVLAQMRAGLARHSRTARCRSSSNRRRRCAWTWARAR